MHGSLQPYFKLYQFPTGRRLFAMQQVQSAAKEMNQLKIAELAQAAIEHDTKTADLETQWRRAKTTVDGRRQRAAEIDSLLDRALGALGTNLQSMARGFEGTERGTRAEQLLQTIFPEGVGAMTSLSYEAELTATDALVRELESRHASHVSALGLEPYVERLKKLAADFHAALKDEDEREVSFHQIRQARTLGQEALLRVVARILGELCMPTDEHIAARQKLLKPIMSQQQRLSDRYAGRRGVTDVDPQTGVEVGETETEVVP